MGRFALKRAAQGVVVVVLVTVVVFIVTRLVGDPVKVLLPFESTPAQRAQFRHELGLDRSIPVQFWDYITDVARLDFGESFVHRQPAIDLVTSRLPATLELVFAGMAFALVLAVPLGVLAALRPGGLLDRFLVTVSLFGLSVPQFWLGELLILVFAVWLDLVPTSGRGGIQSLILPAVTVALPAAGRMAMIARSTMIDELSQPYIQTARAKGLPPRRVIGLHALRNAAIPVLTLGGWETIRALAGFSVVVETVFAWPGIGFLAFNAIIDQDLVVLQAVVLVVAVLVVVINVLTDILYKAIDPRIQLA